VASVRVRLAAVSVDLDEIPCYHAIHGLPAPQGSGSSVVYDVALGRALDWARSQGLPLTLFAVGADMARGESAARLREAADAGHEIGNHTLEHRYDLVRLDAGEMRRQVFAGADVLAGATGQRPVGFRAPGYTVTDALLDVVAESGATYDASVFPCPSYLAAKGAALGAIAARGRASRSILGDPRVALAPTTPYRLGRPFFRPGDGLREIPIQVTSIARLPIIGTSLVLAPAPVASVLVRGALGEPTFNLELHGIDFLDQTDGLAELARHQPDLRVPWETKIARLDAAVDAVRAEGFAFVTMETLAVRALS